MGFARWVEAYLARRDVLPIARAGRECMRRQALSALAVAVFVCLVATVAGGQPLPRGLEGSGSEPTSGSASISIAAVANYAYEPDSIGNVPLNLSLIHI